jgi:D-alanine-D-alanine ligase
LLEENGIPHTGSSAAVAALTFDKRRAKAVAAENGIEVAKEYVFDDLNDAILPLVIKPNAEGSSIGVSIAQTREEFDKAYAQAYTFGNDVLVEQFISGREFSCAVIDVYGEVQALPLIEIRPKNAFFDYESKYVEGMSEEVCPVELDQETIALIEKQSTHMFRTFGIGQYCRFDWILKDSIPYFLEVNTIPGMTPTSLINKEIKAAGIDFDDFIAQLVKKR